MNPGRALTSLLGFSAQSVSRVVVEEDPAAIHGSCGTMNYCIYELFMKKTALSVAGTFIALEMVTFYSAQNEQRSLDGSLRMRTGEERVEPLEGATGQLKHRSWSALNFGRGSRTPPSHLAHQALMLKAWTEHQCRW
jgi:hypothetical protein